MSFLILLFLTGVALVLSDGSGFNTVQRIIGGGQASAGQYPFLAAITKETSDGKYFCGGSVVGSRWILTAGQCVDGAKLFTIYLGTMDIKNPASTMVEVATEEYFLHPDYNPATLENDVGVIRLRMEVVFSPYILPVSLSLDELGGGTTVRSAGWGQTSDGTEGLSDHLRVVSLSSLSNQECKITYGNQITDNMICAAGNYNEGVCHGDIGGPLLTYYLGYQAFLRGIASFVSANGCESIDPSGYTRIAPYVNWVRNITSSG